MIYKKFTAFFSLTLLAAIFSTGLIVNSETAAVKTTDTSPNSVRRNDEAIEYLKQNGTYDSLAEAVTAARYQIQTGENELTAANYANDLQASFSGDGLRLLVRQDDKNAATPEIRWRLSSVGRGLRRTEISGGEIASAENRVEVRRKLFGLVEYFENTPDGLEQGFIFDERPNSETDEPLSLILQSDGDYSVSADADGQGLTLNAKNGGESLRYEKLKSWDADGTELAARMSVSDVGEIRLEVEDAAAKYPVTIDPTFARTAKLTAADGAANDRFGTSVAVSGDTVVVGAIFDDIGANTDQGSAYIFIRSGASWTQQAKLTANDGAANDLFGSSVGISGETVVVGAIFDDIGANTDQGSAYIFIRSGASWTQQAKLIANDGAEDGHFGGSVGISGETVIVGAKSDIVDDQGSAYIFIRGGASWTLQQKLIANNPAVRVRFGISVAVSGETVVVGEGGDPIGGVTTGSAYVFIRSGASWTLQQKLIANDGTAGDGFGESVGISGETVVVGAGLDSIGANDSQGSAYIYQSVGGIWQSEKQTASDGAANDQFGFSVAVSIDTAVVGAPLDDTGAFTDSGAAYVFVKIGGTWTQQSKLLSPDQGSNEKFGESVAIYGDRIIVGAPEDNNSINIDQGAAYIFDRSGTTWIPQSKLTASDGTAFDQFGNSVSISGRRAVVGAYLDNVGANDDQGSAYVFVIGSNTATQEAKLTASDGAASDFFGYSVGISFDTVIAGAYGSDTNGLTDRGAAYIFKLDSAPTWTQQDKLSNSQAGDNQGFSVAISGDTAAVGSPKRTVNGLANAGRVYVYIRGSGTDWLSQTSFAPADGGAGDQFGYSVAIDEQLIAVGSPFNDVNGNSNQGAAYVFARNGTTWTQLTKLTASDGAALDQNGFRTAISGATVISGANLDNIDAAANQGSAYFFKAISTRNAPFDFDGDGKTDIGIFRPAPGEWWINRSSTGQTVAAQFGVSTDRVTPADFTGDGKADIAFFRPSNGNWFVLRSEDSSFFSFPFGTDGDIAVPADYDGDGKADPAVFRPSTATWYISKSSGGTDIFGFGASGDKPVIADYDGDGKADIAIFRPNAANGAEWWIRRSSIQTVFALQFGSSTDQPVQGDFTGDGKADIAFFRPSNGNWFVLRSEDSSFFSFPFGTVNDVPAPGDYDGDGRFDPGVFRPSNSTWYINRSTAGVSIEQFGLTGDKPIPGIFVP